MKMRRILYRLVGSVVAILGFGLILKFYYSTVMISVGTVILICGVAIWMAATPEDYNRADGVVKMITFGDTIRKIEDFYEAFKNVPTPLGSGYLGRFYTMKQPGLIFGPDEYGNYLYFWITNSGINGYLGYSDIPGFIKSRITEPLIPPKEDFADNTADYVCYHSDVILLQKYLFESISSYARTGEVLPIPESEPSEVYTFTEDFKLAGQHFDLCDKDGSLVYSIDGTAPLLKFRIFDPSHREVFRVEKEILHVLPTYRFYANDVLYGKLEKKFELVRDHFTMDITEGRLELTEYAASIGHNFTVTLNGRMLGAIMDDLELTIHNLIFDNAVMIVYDTDYLPLMTAMAIMVARESARDEEDD